MDLFGVGPLELLLIFFLLFIIFSPKELKKTGKSLGRALNRLVRSETWQMLSRTGREIQHLPARLMREANLEEIVTQIDPRPDENLTTRQPASEPVPAERPVPPPAQPKSEENLGE